MSQRKLKGMGASVGIAVGNVFLLDRRRIQIPKYHISPDGLQDELSRLHRAIAAADEQFQKLKEKWDAQENALPHGGILEAYRLILHDEYLLLPTCERIEKEYLNAEWAFQKTLEDIKRRFDQIGVEHFRERRSDVGFVGDQVLQNLMGKEPSKPPQPPKHAIVVAHELSPTDLLQMQHKSIAGIITATGGRTSHMVILARAFQLPVVLGLGDAIDQLGALDLVIMDGSTGEVFLDPPESLVHQYQATIDTETTQFKLLTKNRDEPAETKDHKQMRLLANIEFHEEIPIALAFGASGVGLYRTEFLFLDRTSDPSEEEHFLYTKEVLLQLGNKPATFRTFDLGTDKLPPFLSSRIGMLPFTSELNPALGLRSLRLCLRERKLFKTQLRGLLRASIYGDMRLMFPMISGISDLREAKAVLEECKDELWKEGLPFRSDLPVGIMIEMPSAVMVADHLAKEASFFSIGTNDLIQYTLALDRTNESVEMLHDPLHPAILRMIKRTVDAGHLENRSVSLCGEMAGNPLMTGLLLGLGLDELSMSPASLPKIKQIIQQSSLADADALAKKALQLCEGRLIEQLIQENMAAALSVEG